ARDGRGRAPARRSSLSVRAFRRTMGTLAGGHGAGSGVRGAAIERFHAGARSRGSEIAVCGIAGWWEERPSAGGGGGLDSLTAMLRQMVPRGPDDAGSTEIQP